MIRVLFGLILVAGIAAILSDPQTLLAQKGGNSGVVKKIDPATGTITFTMQVPIKGTKKKTELGEKEFFLTDDAKVTINEGGQTKTMTGKEAIAAGVVKAGTAATFVPDDLKLKELTLGGGKKMK